MRPRRNSKLLVEPPASATGDIAFNLIVFFLVCASVQPDSGRPQTLPRSEKEEKEKTQEKHVEVQLKRSSLMLNGDVIQDDQFVERLRSALSGKPRPEDKIVVVKSDKDVEYQRWIVITMMIEEAGGTLTIQREEERTVQIQ